MKTINSKVIIVSVTLILSIVSILTISPVYATSTFLFVTETIPNTRRIVNAIGGVMVTLLFIGFFWSLAKFILAPAQQKAEQKTMLLWTSLAMFVGLSIWGIIAFLKESTGLGEIQNDTVRQRITGLIIGVLTN